MGSLGVPELIIIFLVVLLVFGARRIPEIARGLGKGIREFKDATTDIKREFDIEDTQRDTARQDPPRRVEAPRQAPAPRADSPAQRHPEPVEPRPAQPDIEDARSQP